MFRSFFVLVALCLALLCAVSAAPIGTDSNMEALARRLASRPETGDLLFERRSAGVKVGLQPRARVSYRTDKTVVKPQVKKARRTLEKNAAVIEASSL